MEVNALVTKVMQTVHLSTGLKIRTINLLLQLEVIGNNAAAEEARLLPFLGPGHGWAPLVSALLDASRTDCVSAGGAMVAIASHFQHTQPHLTRVLVPLVLTLANPNNLCPCPYC
jgi:hypothetical protein